MCRIKTHTNNIRFSVSPDITELNATLDGELIERLTNKNNGVKAEGGFIKETMARRLPYIMSPIQCQSEEMEQNQTLIEWNNSQVYWTNYGIRTKNTITIWI
jgi:hypothetical protein